MTEKLCWGILSTGAIARAFAAAVPKSATSQLLAVASRTTDSAEKFAAEFNIPRRYGNYEALLTDKDVQAVYIATPHPFHIEWVIKAAESGKHILCEKPFTLNHAEAMAGIEAVRANGVFFMEAFMYRCHPQTAKLVELLRAGVIGDVRMVQATFSFQTVFNPASRLFNNALGGGGILDVGCYPVSFARLVAGAATGQAFADPVDVKGVAHLGVTGVDEWATAVLKFPGDILAQISTGVALNQENVARIFGTTGCLVLPFPWVHNRHAADAGKILIYRGLEPMPIPEEIDVPSSAVAYTLEVDAAGRTIAAGQLEAPAMTWDDTLGNARTLDQWRLSAGLVYEAEKPAHYTHTVSRRPLTIQQPVLMKYGAVAGVSKPISRLVMGCDNQTTMPHAAVLFDYFFERGGNTFDTAFAYGTGIMEWLLGRWIKNRAVREQVVIISKGGITPLCTPAGLTWQLQQSLHRLKTDYVDIYLLHRDNPEIPVGEFVDCLNEHLAAGRIRAFGGSNWSLERVAAANRYAKRKGLTGFTAISNQFSLAEWLEPIWGGCLSVSDAVSRKWLKQKALPNFCWSSQARGFFGGAAAPGNRSDPEMVRCWYSADNFRRLERVNELAAKRGVLPINVALAYVLNQPFPNFALIGPRTLQELRQSLPALEIELTPKELRWLNLE